MILLQTAPGATLQLDCFGGAEHLARAVQGLQGDVGLGGVYRYHGLEALAGGCAEGLHFIWASPGQHLPGGYLRGAVPTGVDRYLIVGSELGDDGRVVVGRLPTPREAECPVFA